MENVSASKEDVYEQGYQDYFDLRNINPYDEGTETELHLAWEAGWFDAQFEEQQ